jgi:putative heme-binding domain-containing protein
LDALRSWANPSVFDRVDGRYRGENTRDDGPLKAALMPLLTRFLKSTDSEVQAVSARIAAQLAASNQVPNLIAILKSNSNYTTQIAALEALSKLKASNLPAALSLAIDDDDERVRAVALEILPTSEIAENKAVELFDKLLINASSIEKQAIYRALSSLKGEKAQRSLGKALDNLISGEADQSTHLDIIEAVIKQGNKSLIEKLEGFQLAQLEKDSLALFTPALFGGNARKGHDIFYEHEAAQCIRCHTVFEFGGNAGPGLATVADRLSPRKLLESMVYPSASFAVGYEVVSLKLLDGSTVAGIISNEDKQKLELKVGKESRTVYKAAIKERTSIPSSMLPMAQVLTKSEIRDVIAFLYTLTDKDSD